MSNFEARQISPIIGAEILTDDLTDASNQTVSFLIEAVHEHPRGQPLFGNDALTCARHRAETRS